MTIISEPVAFTHNITNSMTENKLENLANISRFKYSKKIEEVAQEFETLFLNKIINSLYEHVKIDSMMDDKKGPGRIYKSWIIDEYSKLLSASGRLGIADNIQATLLKYQEVGDGNR